MRLLDKEEIFKACGEEYMGGSDMDNAIDVSKAQHQLDLKEFIEELDGMSHNIAEKSLQLYRYVQSLKQSVEEVKV